MIKRMSQAGLLFICLLLLFVHVTWYSEDALGQEKKQQGSVEFDPEAFEQGRETEDFAHMDWDNILQLEEPDDVSVSLDAVEELADSAYKGKTFSIIGDSYSQRHAGFWWSKEKYRWWAYVSKRLGMSLDTNASVFGLSLHSYMADEDFSLGNPDYIFILIGANDFADGYKDQLYDAYVSLLDQLGQEYPNASIVMITYPYYLTNGDFIGAQQFVNPLMRQVAKETGVLLVDTDAKSYDNIIDGVHTNPEGSFYIGNCVVEFLEKTCYND